MTTMVKLGRVPAPAGQFRVPLSCTTQTHSSGKTLLPVVPNFARLTVETSVRTGIGPTRSVAAASAFCSAVPELSPLRTGPIARVGPATASPTHAATTRRPRSLPQIHTSSCRHALVDGLPHGLATATGCHYFSQELPPPSDPPLEPDDGGYPLLLVSG